ncbi:hypothetical protein ACQVTS_26415 [Bacillus mycoides]|uniref:hypothetical protein n=1 Tax=Bacillus mycoides TaxID=1405 RepID=UPI003D65D2BB
MDKVQEFIANNSHQFGYIMDEAARQWAEKDPKGALTVGPCKTYTDTYGDYHKVLDKLFGFIEKKEKNVTSVEVEVDTKEANGNIKELTAAVNECVEAFEKLEKVMIKFTNRSETVELFCDGKLIDRSVVKQTTDGYKMSATNINGVKTNETK